MAQPRRPDTAPWIVAGVAGVILIALLSVYFFVLRPDEDDVAGALTAQERTVMTAAGTEAANVLSFRRSQFEQDFQRALSGATGALADDLRRAKSTTRKTITDGKFDMSATVTHTALEGPVSGKSRHGYTVLVTLNGYRSNAPSQPTPSQLALTVLSIKGNWLVSDVENIGVSA
jgi:hypothetical protein